MHPFQNVLHEARVIRINEQFGEKRSNATCGTYRKIVNTKDNNMLSFTNSSTSNGSPFGYIGSLDILLPKL